MSAMPLPDPAPAGGVRGGALRVAVIAGVPVYVSSSWLLVAAAITYVFKPTVEARLPGIGDAAYLVSGAFAVLLYACVLVHELGHTFVALSFGLPVSRIDLQVLGGASRIEKEAETPWREFAVSAAGPAVSLLLGGAALLGAYALPDETIADVLVLELAVANLGVGVFNLLPGLPLDGGRVLFSGIWALTHRRARAVVAAAWAGRVVAVLVGVSPLALALRTNGAVSRFSFIWSTFLAFSLWQGATSALRSAAIRQTLSGLRAGDLARSAIGVSAQMSIAEAINRAEAAECGAVVVVSPDGTPIALVSEAAVFAVPDDRRPWVSTGELSRRLEAGLRIDADASGERLLAALNASPDATEWAVMGPDATLVGVLHASDLELALAGRTRTPT